MINHARTLLLNYSAANAIGRGSAAEYVPNNFSPVKLPNALEIVRRTLFGVSSAANDAVLFRVRELLRYIHETELGDYIYALDSRVTYWPETSTSALAALQQIYVRQTAGVKQTLAVGGSLNNTSPRTNTLEQYIVTLTDTDFSARSTTSSEPTTSVVLSGGLIPALRLPATSLKVVPNGLSALAPPEFSAAATELDDILIFEDYATPNVIADESAEAGTPEAATDAVWSVTVLSRPQSAITTLLPILEMLGEPVLLELFGVADIEPYVTFKNLWFDHPLPVYRLAGFVLALIYRTDSIRKQNG